VSGRLDGTRHTAARHRGFSFLRRRKSILKPTIASQSWVFRFFGTYARNMRTLKGNMRNRTGNKVVRTRFGPETQFEIGPFTLAPVPMRGQAESELEQLKARLLGQLLEKAAEAEPGLHAALRRAANEAAGVAWFTPFPLLVFPTLLEEKAAKARRQQERQRQIRQRTQGLLEEALSE
jgi:hypothetical protein